VSEQPNDKTPRLCSVDGCRRPSRVRGWCRTHYTRWRRHGDPTTVAFKFSGPGSKGAPVSHAERLWMKIRRDASGCWIWTGSIDQNGYGRFGRGRGAYRDMYELIVGPVPEGLHLDHLCRNRACVNPSHLEPVTLVENIRRGWASRRLAATKSA
jgi:hypothetical protein